MKADADVLILGGGCAGLSLAVALADRAPGMRVQILEQRATYQRDRTWCFWNAEPHPFEAAVTHRWPSWRVRHGGSEALQRSRRYSYDYIPGERFYDLAQWRLREAGFALEMGVSVQEVRCAGDGCRVETDRGVLAARWVFDARTPAAAEVRPVLLQRFEGWHVRTEQPCFAPDVVELMDFAVRQEAGRTAFVYVLPFSRTEALVEATFLDAPEMPAADGAAWIRRWLEERQSGACEVMYRESGALPMGGAGAPVLQGARMVAIGTRGGRVKASSGYAFLRIQRQSAALAAALAVGGPMPKRFEPRSFGVLDAIFLRALRRRPERAPEYFLSLFRRLPADVLVRFLSEVASPGEVARAMLALPKKDFVQAALLPGVGASAC